MAGRKDSAPLAQFAASEVRARLARLREVLKKKKLDGLLVNSVASVRYLSGFTGDSSAVMVTRRGQYLVTDSRFEEEAAISAPLFKALIHKRGLSDMAARTAARLKLKRLGYEEPVITAAQLGILIDKLGKKRLLPTSLIVERLRAVKSPAEVAAVRRAVHCAEKGLRSARSAFKAGTSERSAAAVLRYRMASRFGAQDQAFETIVAEGPRGSLPHARPTERSMGPNSVVLIDWGARAGFYHSDLTRVLALGRIPRLYRKLVRVVREAQLAALEQIKSGVPAKTVDRAARRVIEKAGWGPQFGHSTGHGLGLEVHEFPRIAARSGEKLEAGMIFTVEPGIYLPGRFGIRLEDDVLVTESGCEVLSSLAHDERWRGD